MGTQTTTTTQPAYITQGGQTAVTAASGMLNQPYRAYGSAAPATSTPAAPYDPKTDPNYIALAAAGRFMGGDFDPLAGGGNTPYTPPATTPAPSPAQDTSQFKYWDSGPVADLDPDEVGAIQGVRNAQGNWGDDFGAGDGLIKAASQGMDGGSPSYDASMVDAPTRWSGTQAKTYMNPYIDKVLDGRMKNLQRSADIATRDRSLTTALTGNWGGARQGIADAEAGRNLLDQQDTTYASGMNDAWDKGLTAFNSDENRSVDVGKTNAAAKNSASEFNISNYLKQFNTDKDRAMTGGTNLISAAGSKQKYALQDADALEKAGAIKRDIEQKKRDFDVEEYRRSQEKPYKDVGLISNAVNGAPRDTTTATNTPSNTLGNILGAAGSILSFI